MANKQKHSDRRAGKRRDRSSKVGSRAPELGYGQSIRSGLINLCKSDRFAEGIMELM